MPWPGTSAQLAGIPYTGERQEALFCCGNGPYNKAIERWASLITNGSEARAEERRQGQRGGEEAALRFHWVSELYPKAHVCKTSKANATRAKRKGKQVEKVQCGYSFENLASHPLAVLLPYSMHSYGLVQAYALGIPLVAPSLALLASAHTATGIASHKGAGNTPWRPSRGRGSPPFLNRWLVKDNLAWFIAPPPSGDVPCCATEPDDACTPAAAAKWLQFADWYQWPHITYFDTPQELFSKVEALLRNSSARHAISKSMKAFFSSERQRAAQHVRSGLQRSLQAAAAARVAVGQRSSLVRGGVLPTDPPKLWRRRRQRHRRAAEGRRVCGECGDAEVAV